MAEHNAAQVELQALADHWAKKFHSPALAWGVVLDGRLALSGGSGTLGTGRSPSTSGACRCRAGERPRPFAGGADRRLAGYRRDRRRSGGGRHRGARVAGAVPAARGRVQEYTIETA